MKRSSPFRRPSPSPSRIFASCWATYLKTPKRPAPAWKTHTSVSPPSSPPPTPSSSWWRTAPRLPRASGRMAAFFPPSARARASALDPCACLPRSMGVWRSFVGKRGFSKPASSSPVKRLGRNAKRPSGIVSGRRFFGNGSLRQAPAQTSSRMARVGLFWVQAAPATSPKISTVRKPAEAVSCRRLSRPK